MQETAKHIEPRWPAMVALLAVGGLRLALPHSLSVGPDWLLIVVIGFLILVYGWARQREKYEISTFLGYLLISIVTADMAWSLCLLVAALPTHKETSLGLLRSAAALWITNIIVFASWYWRLDAGGPHAREVRGVQTDGAFLFPQMMLVNKPDAKEENNAGTLASSITCFWLSIPARRFHLPTVRF